MTKIKSKSKPSKATNNKNVKTVSESSETKKPIQTQKTAVKKLKTGGNKKNAKKSEAEAEDNQESESEDKNDDVKMESSDNEETATKDIESEEEEEEDDEDSDNDVDSEGLKPADNDDADMKESNTNSDNPGPADSEETPKENPSILDKKHEDPYLLKDAEYIKKDLNWRNKQRTLLFSSRGISGQHRHLIDDLKKLLPHHKVEQKFEKQQDFSTLNEIAELKGCNNVLFFEARKHTDLYLHMARSPHGPTIKFAVNNIHTSGEIRLSGNCLKYSRPLLTFDHSFDQVLESNSSTSAGPGPSTDPMRPHLKLIKELLIQSLGTPRNHPKSKPFHDHVISFFYEHGRVYLRHYQISPLTDSPTDIDDPEKQVLTEIGPRLTLTPIWILNNSFSGKKIYGNSDYLSPTANRRKIKQEQGVEAKLKSEQKLRKEKEEEELDKVGRVGKLDEGVDEIFEESSSEEED